MGVKTGSGIVGMRNAEPGKWVEQWAENAQKGERTGEGEWAQTPSRGKEMGKPRDRTKR